MKVRELHRWDVPPAEARQIQQELRKKVSGRNTRRRIQHVAGVDIGVKNNHARAAVVVLLPEELEAVEVVVAEGPANFPYVPGLLSFREIPLLARAFERLSIEPDLLFVDGQGFAHPRRIGIASHLGLLLDKPTIGCAKSRLCGTHDEPDTLAGCYTDLWDGDELIGAVLRTRDGVKPLYISVGHKIDLGTAIDWVLACGRGFRLPEPTRLAHQAASGTLRQRRNLTTASRRK
jgi:deoxyribonuclease V